MNKQLAKVTSASLKLIDQGILTFYIFVNYEDGGSQGVGGIALDEYVEAKKKRVGTAFGCEVIRRVLEAFNINDLIELKGKYLWVLGEGEGLGFSTKGVRPLNLDSKKPEDIIFSEILKEFKKGMNK